jgi:hypothetical protein
MRSSDSPRERNAIDLVAVTLVCLAVSAWAAYTQRTERLFADAQRYHGMSQQFYESRRPVSVHGPFAYRIGAPWLASVIRPAVEAALPTWLDVAIERAAGMKGVAPFYVLNIAASFAAALLLLLYFRCFIPSVAIRILLVTAWIAMWHSPVRFVYFYPVNVDALFFVFLVGALLVVEKTRGWSAGAAAFALAPIVFAGTLVRETMFVAALAFAVAHRRTERGGVTTVHLLALAVPFAACALALACVRWIAVANPPSDWWTQPMNMLREKPVFTWVLAWFYALGPSAIALMTAAFREVRAFLGRRPELGMHLAVCGVLAFFGGTDTERILAWSAPAAYVLVGQAIAARREVLARMPLLVAALGAVQLASSRLLWPIPVGIDDARRFADLHWSWRAVVPIADKFLVIHNYYSNLWSFFGSRSVHTVTLIFDLVLAAGVAFLIQRRQQQLRQPAPGLAQERVDRAERTVRA